MDLISERISALRAMIPDRLRYGLIALLIVLSFVFLFVGGGLSNNVILGFIIVFIVATLFLAFQPRRAICAAIIFAFFCISLYIRVGPSHDGVFLGDWVAFSGNDPWYHMRLVENLVHHFPHRLDYDAYTIFPTGMQVQFSPFFDWLLGFFVWLIGWGHPSTQTIETVGAYFPAVLGALLTIPVYFIGKELFNRTAGLLAAGLIAIMPGEVFFRSMLGFTDHHIAEVLFSSTTVLFLILAIKSAKREDTSFGQFHSGDWWGYIRSKQWRELMHSCEWSRLRKPLFFSALTGIMLGIYLLSWVGGFLFVGIILAYLVIQYMVDHLRGKATDYICVIGFPVFLIALIMVGPNMDLLVYPGKLIALLVVGFAVVPALGIVSRSMIHFKLARFYFPVAVIVLGGIGVGLFKVIAPEIFNDMLSQLKEVFLPGVYAQTIMEARPFFAQFDFSYFRDQKLWRYFTTCFVLVPLSFFLIIFESTWRKTRGKYLLAAFGFVILLTVLVGVLSNVSDGFRVALYCIFFGLLLVYAYFERSEGKVLLIIWSYIILLAMVGQTRFSYYFAINAALLAGYLCCKIPGWFTWVVEWITRREPSPVEERKKRKADKRERRKAQLAQEAPRDIFIEYRRVIKYASSAVAAIAVFFLAFYYPIGQAKLLASSPFGPNDAWHSSLVWMRENTPEPFDNPDFYYDVYSKPQAGESYDYPESAYGVMSWWDYGHWITRIAHRIPNANPHQIGIGGRTADGSIIPGASTFMTAQNESEGSWILDELGSKYVVIDIETDTTKYHTMTIWGGLNPSDFFERYYQNTAEGVQSVLLYYPRYYESMCSRLYNFECKAVAPNNSTWAVTYDEVTDDQGNKIKMLTGAANEGLPFATYGEAADFIAANPDYVIVGLHPFLSPVPLGALEHYKMVHGSSGVINMGDVATSYVKIFEYTP